MHLDEERVQRLLHAELKPAMELEARQHLAGCQDCRLLVSDARAEEDRIFGQLRELDHPLPEADSGAILAAGRASRARWERWAAGVLLVAAAGGAAYAAPGSPLPGALNRLISWVAPARTPSGPVETAADAPSAGGIAVAPGERLTIRFVGDRDSTIATVSLSDDDEVFVRAVKGSAAFTSDVDRLSVHSTGPARFEILIPRRAPSVEIVAGERPVFRMEASRVVSETPRDAEGRYLILLSESAR